MTTPTDEKHSRHDVEVNNELQRRKLRQWATPDLIRLASRGWEASLQRRLAVEFGEMDYGRYSGKEFFTENPLYNLEIHAYVLELIMERIA